MSTTATVAEQPTVVTVTGAAGAIGYATLFRIAAGAMLGPDRPIALRLLELPQAVSAAEGTAMELEDGAFGLLRSVDIFDDPRAAFDRAQFGLLIGAKPRSQGMERSDLLGANSAIFATQGAVINEVADEAIRVLVVGNPANTNAAVASAHAPDVPAARFNALTRLDHNRAIAQLARRTGATVNEIRRVTIWGNHSASQYPDIFHAHAGPTPGAEVAADERWLVEDFIPTVARRGTAIIAARGASSAASAANAAIDHIRDWVGGTPEGDWTSAAVPSTGAYGIGEGLFCSLPVRSIGGEWDVVRDLDINPLSRRYIDASVAELEEELAAVAALSAT